jgi:hypothetical protein
MYTHFYIFFLSSTELVIEIFLSFSMLLFCMALMTWDICYKIYGNIFFYATYSAKL